MMKPCLTCPYDERYCFHRRECEGFRKWLGPELFNRTFALDRYAAVSEPRSGHPRFYQLVEEIAALHSRKAADYSGSNADPLSNLSHCEALGVAPFLGVMVRMTDKWDRLINLARRWAMKEGGPAVKDESVIDTLKDLAVYSLLAVILFEETSKGEPNA